MVRAHLKFKGRGPEGVGIPSIHPSLWRCHRHQTILWVLMWLQLELGTKSFAKHVSNNCHTKHG